MAGGRPKHAIRSKFEDVLSPDVVAAKTDKQYEVVRCKYCMAMHILNSTTIPKPEALSARLSVLQEHERGCRYAIAAKAPGGEGYVSPFATWDPADKTKLEQLCLDVVAQNNLPAAFVSSTSFKALVEGVCPGSSTSIPSRKLLGGTILNERARECEDKMKADLLELQTDTNGRVSLLSDVWMNVSKKHVVGSQLILFGQTFTQELMDAGTRHDGPATAELLERIMKVATADGFTIGCLVTDNAGQCAMARRILQVRYPKIVFIACKAHDINNLVKQVLNLPRFKQVTSQASAVVNTLNGSSSKWLALAQDFITHRYKLDGLQFHRLCATRWNSMHGCFSSLLRVKEALKSFYHEYKSVRGFPVELGVLGNNAFWARLDSAERLIKPLSKASFMLQRDRNTVADVVHAFKKIYTTFAQHDECPEELVACIESRWLACEQPFFLLGYFLHPKYRFEAVKMRCSDITVSEIMDIAVYYYRRLIGDYKELRNDLLWWFAKEKLGVRLEDYRPNEVLGYWQQVGHGRQGKELAHLAITVFSAAVNTATCERLFSELGAIHSKSRNRMEAETARKYYLVRKRIRDVDGSSQADKKRHRIIDATERPRMDIEEEKEQEPPSTPPSTTNSTSGALLTPGQHETESCETSRDGGATEAPDGLEPQNIADIMPEETPEDCVADTYGFWQRTLDTIFQDEETQEEYHAGPGSCEINAYEPIPAPIIKPFNAAMPQESSLSGLRGLKIRLAAMFPIYSDSDE